MHFMCIYFGKSYMKIIKLLMMIQYFKISKFQNPKFQNFKISKFQNLNVII